MPRLSQCVRDAERAVLLEVRDAGIWLDLASCPRAAYIKTELDVVSGSIQNGVYRSSVHLETLYIKIFPDAHTTDKNGRND